MQSSDLPSEKELKKYHNWWKTLSETWKKAFNEAYAQRSTTDILPDFLLFAIWTSPIFRMAGPKAPYPNVQTVLTDISGILALEHLEILVLTHHQINSLKGIGNLKKLKSLFVFDNKLTSIEPLSEMVQLKEVYVNANYLTTLAPLAKLTQLEVVHCAHNDLKVLDGLGLQHTAMRDFFCLPNEGIWSSEINRFEGEVKIQCKKG